MIEDGTNSAIESHYLEKFISKSYFLPIEILPPKFIFLSVDPNAGGANEYSLIAMINHFGQKVVSLFTLVLRH
jgi:hypothetical protein